MEATKRTWYHTIDLPDGSSTHGWYDTRPATRYVQWPDDVGGGRCLDVGTFDGFWAFELERRGAREVVAIDLDDPERLDFSFDMRDAGPRIIREWGSGRGPGFEEAARELGSSVVRKNRSVYELDPSEDGEFDVVLCGALLLHLRDPALALERIRSVCRGAFVLVEALDHRLELLASRIPVAAVAPVNDEWWVPNSRGLERLVYNCGFEITKAGPRFLVRHGPGGPANPRFSAWSGIAARRPGARGLLHRTWTAQPRPPCPPAG